METEHAVPPVDVFADVLLVLAVAGVIVPLLSRLRVPSVLGYLLCGLLLGPFGLALLVPGDHWVQALVIRELEEVELLGELGIVFLLFTIGLEFSFQRLWDLKRLVLGLGGSQIIITGLAIFGLALAFGNELQPAILIGLSLALSSTAIVMQLLTERRLMNRPVGTSSFAILLMQDLAVVPILVLVTVFSGEGEGGLLYQFGRALLLAVLTVLIIYVIGRRLIRPVLQMLSPTRNDEWLMALVLLTVVGTAIATQSAGLSAALGAFLAGMLISETDFRHEVEAIMSPLKGLLLGVFFLSVGMRTDLRAIMENPLWIAGSVAGLFFLKAAILYPLARAFRLRPPQAGETAVMLAQGGEFALLTLSLAMAGGIIGGEDGQFFLLVAVTSMLLAPLTTLLRSPVRHWLERRERGRAGEEDGEQPPERRVLIAGFGRVGERVAAILEKEMVPYLAVEQDAERVAGLRRRGGRVIVGDARKMELWRRLHAEEALAILITIDDPAGGEAILRAIRRNWPLVPVIMRARDTGEAEALYNLGATQVVPEALEASMQLARKLLDSMGVDDPELETKIEQVRKG